MLAIAEVECYQGNSQRIDLDCDVTFEVAKVELAATNWFSHYDRKKLGRSRL